MVNEGTTRKNVLCEKTWAASEFEHRLGLTDRQFSHKEIEEL